MPSIRSKTATAQEAKDTAVFCEALSVFLARLPERSRAIMEARFGVSGNRQKTLEEIGQQYHITRERVRQVIGNALGFLASEQGHECIVRIKDIIRTTLRDKSGVMDADALLEMLSRGDKKECGALLAFLESLSVVKEEKLTDERRRVFVLDGFSFKEWKEVKDTAKRILESSEEVLDADTLFARFSAENKKVDRKTFFDFLAVARDVRQNVFGQWGLESSSDIRPRGTREKAHLVLKTTKKPLHFREIAKLIDTYGLQGKKGKSHPQTVHNELIKDKRFVLVGRGIYALSEWGYAKGTVKEVIAKILASSQKPMTREEILEAVLKVRQVKKSTVIINLNTFFERVGKDTYVAQK
jgi:DNA-directed RNA polymerase delta subunit